MPTWNPDQYLSFADERLRPALDLLAQVPLEKAGGIIDLGCGPGNVTPYLERRWPDAVLTGVDSSPEMLEKARAALPQASWLQADIAEWSPAKAPDLIYSNAALHWLSEHEVLFPRLLNFLAPGGCLAVQMPQTAAGAWRRAAQDLAGDGPWAAKLADLRRPGNVQMAAAYYRILAPHCSKVEIWETDYLHALSGPDPVAEWTKGAGLRPFLDRLEGDEKVDFYTAYAERLRALYPPQPDGRTLMTFRRLFVVALRKSS